MPHTPDHPTPAAPASRRWPKLAAPSGALIALLLLALLLLPPLAAAPPPKSADYRQSTSTAFLRRLEQRPAGWTAGFRSPADWRGQRGFSKESQASKNVSLRHDGATTARSVWPVDSNGRQGGPLVSGLLIDHRMGLRLPGLARSFPVMVGSYTWHLHGREPASAATLICAFSQSASPENP